MREVDRTRHLSEALADATDRFGGRPEYMRVWAWDQTWGHATIGFPGVGAAAVTTALTVVIRVPTEDGMVWAVYHGGRYAYDVPDSRRTEVLEGIRGLWLPGQVEWERVLYFLAEFGPSTAAKIAEWHNRSAATWNNWTPQTAAGRLRGLRTLGLVELGNGAWKLTTEGREWMVLAEIEERVEGEGE